MKPTACPHCGSLTYDYAGLVIEDLAGGRVRCGDVVAVLPRREVQALHCLLESKGRTVPKDRLYSSMYAQEVDGGPDETCVESHISKLRKKLRDMGAPVSVFHMRFLGYTLRTRLKHEVVA